MNFLYYLLIALVLNMSMFVCAYLFRTDKFTDISYCVTFVLLAALALASVPTNLVSWVLFSMIALWALRLGSFLLVRIHHFKRDKRFDAMRGNFIKFAGFWFLQAISAWVILLPSLMAFTFERSFSSIHMIGGLIWGAGLTIESIADGQKYRFIQQSTTSTWIDKGLWAYSRHPNYFGEILVWIGIYIFTLPHLQGWYSVVGLFSPLYIIGLLCFVSGIPILEKSADERYKSDDNYWRYKKSTSILIPWYKKRVQ